MVRLNRWSKRLAGILVLAAVALFQYYQVPLPGTDETRQPLPNEQGTTRSTQRWQAGEWITIEAKVTRILNDDNEGSRHQRFVIALPDQRTLLVAHNIDLAERVPVKTGDTVRLRGQYELNERGGVVHWTHHAPGSSASAGWIEHRGRRYQ